MSASAESVFQSFVVYVPAPVTDVSTSSGPMRRDHSCRA